MRTSLLATAVLALFPLACNCGGSAQVWTQDGGRASGDAGRRADAGGGDPGDAGSCGSVVLQGNLVPGNVVVVFDQSDSMNQAFGDAGPKYKVASAALVNVLTPLQAELNVGAIFQPTGGEQGGVCPPVAPISMPPQIPITTGANFLTAWNNHFLPPWKLLLGTPLGDALNQANAALQTPPPGKTVLVVMTDGQPNCGETLSSILVPVQALAARGIKTYVVGLPGASGATVLQDIADAGGTGTYLLPSDGQALAGELSQIATNALDQCTFQLVPPPSDPTQVHLVVTPAGGGGAFQLEQDGGSGGWGIGADGQTVTLWGSVCGAAEDGGYSALAFQYGCVTVPYQ